MTTKTKRKAASSEVRILPATIGVGAILLVLKASGLAFGANAAETESSQAPKAEIAAASQPPAAAPAANVETKRLATPEGAGSSPPVTLPNAKADPLAAINDALPNRADKPLIEPPETLTSNALSSELPDGGLSPAEMDVLNSLSQRRNTLDERQRELDLKANVIAAAEKRVEDKIAQLKALQGTIEKLLGQRDTKETESLDNLVRVYAAMKPKDAARIFETLDNGIRLGVAGRMKPDTVAGIMTSLPAEVAQKITVELAQRYKMTPELTAAAAAANAPVPAAAPAPSATPPAAPAAKP